MSKNYPYKYVHCSYNAILDYCNNSLERVIMLLNYQNLIV